MVYTLLFGQLVTGRGRAERCRSGRSGRFRKPLWGSNPTGGSNPSLSASFPAERSKFMWLGALFLIWTGLRVSTFCAICARKEPGIPRILPVLPRRAIQTPDTQNPQPACYAHDAANRVTSIRNCLFDGSPLCCFEYEYDVASRITSITRENGDIIYYGYDDADRLTSEMWKAPDLSTIYAFEWDYDVVGNRVWESRDGVETYHEYNAAKEPAESSMMSPEHTEHTILMQGATNFCDANPNVNLQNDTAAMRVNDNCGGRTP